MYNARRVDTTNWKNLSAKEKYLRMIDVLSFKDLAYCVTSNDSIDVKVKILERKYVYRSVKVKPVDKKNTYQK